MTTSYTERSQVPAGYRWDLSQIYPDTTAWRAAIERLTAGIDTFAALRGTLASDPRQLLRAYQLEDDLGQLAYKVWYFVSLRHDEDLRDNTVGASRQEVMILFARWRQAASWFAPEILGIPLATLRGWMDDVPALAVYRFVVEDLFRQQAHVLDAAGERLLSLAGRLGTTPSDTYAALATADARFETLHLGGEEITVTPGRYRAIITTNRDQADRAAAYEALYTPYVRSANTYASIYDGVLQRDWFLAEARGFATTLEAALHGNDIPVSVVEHLITATRAGLAPLHRYHALRKRVLDLAHYHPYDTALPLVDLQRTWPYEQASAWVLASVAPLGEAYQAQLAQALGGGYIDVYETPGKQSGAYSAPVYGVHPYMLLNYNETLDAVFTLAHELGHTMHTLRAHTHQPFVYAGYTIFVAEVPSTLSEALFLDYMLKRAESARERAALLEHAINEITGTFYGQVMFADFELRAHRMVEQGLPVTADALGALYAELLREWFGPALTLPPLAAASWARVSHFFGSPYYVYQYATCFASSAQLFRQISDGTADGRAAAIQRYLALLEAGGSDHPMKLLQRAGVDLARPEPVQAVVDQMDALVTRLELELSAL